MRWFRRSILLSAAILAAGCLAAGCGGTVSSAISSLAPSRSASSATATTSSSTTSPSPTATSPAATTAPSPSVTVTTTTTTTATASPPVTTQPTSSEAPGGNSGTSLLWLWILLGAVALAGLIAGIVRSARRRSAAAAGWQSKVIDAYAKGSALYDAMSVAETPGALAADDAAARWYDIQRRADDLAQTLYALRESAPDEDARARVADTIASLQAVRSAIEAERAPGGAGAQYADVVPQPVAVLRGISPRASGF